MDNNTLDYIAQQLEKAAAEIHHLELKLQVLKELQDELRNDESAVPVGLNGLGPTAAIKRILMRMPGLDANAVVDRLKDKISSNADDLRRTLKSTIYTMVTNGVLTRNKKGMLFLVSEGEDHPNV